MSKVTSLIRWRHAPPQVLADGLSSVPAACRLDHLTGGVSACETGSRPQLSFLINENILGKCFRSCSSFINPRISPLTIKYQCPQLSLLIIIHVLETNKTRTRILFYYPMLMYSRPLYACFEHSNLFKVNEWEPHRNGRVAPATTAF